MPTPNFELTDDIPKIEREGFTRGSKYDEVLDAVAEKAGKAARINVETQGQASSRASSIKSAAENHAKVKSGEGHFEVATRTVDDGYAVFVKYVEGPAPEEKPKKAKKAKVAKAAKA